MIERVTDYLVHQPSDTGSPLYLALNTPEMIAAQGIPDNVTLYDVDVSAMNVPYVYLHPSTQVEPGNQLIGGGYTEWDTLLLDSVAVGETPLQAQERAETMRLEVENVLQNFVIDNNSGPLANRVALANPNSYDQVLLKRVVSNSPQTVVSGSNQNGRTLYKTTSTTQLKVLVLHQRRRAS